MSDIAPHNEYDEERMATDQRWFDAPDEAFDAFSALCDSPLASTTRLEALAQRSTPFVNE